MQKFKSIAALVALVSLASGVAFAQDAMKGGMAMDTIDMHQNSRFSGPGVYTGPPALGVTLAVVEAGGGPSNFQTTTLLKTLTGDKFDAEVGSLTKTYGKDEVTQFIKTFDFIIADALKFVKDNNVKLPAEPAVDPKNGPALAAAIYHAATLPNGKLNVEIALDKLVGHTEHVQIMKDIDAKYGETADAQYHVIFAKAVEDLGNVYHLSGSKM